MTKIGILIPSTNRGLNCKNYKDTPFYKIFLKYFIKSYDRSGKFHFKIYIVVDKDDPIYSNRNEMIKLKKFIDLVKFLDIAFFWSEGIEKGHVTEMWNRAFYEAYKDGCEYFYQSGDDICIMDRGWEVGFIGALKKMNNLGVVGPFDFGRFLYEKENNVKQKFLLTQSFVSRLHYEIFGFYFDPEIKNWFCDDWITYVYGQLGRMQCSKHLRIQNMGGDPRYVPVGEGDEWKPMSEKCKKLIHNGGEKIKKFIKEHNEKVAKLRS